MKTKLIALSAMFLLLLSLVSCMTTPGELKVVENLDSLNSASKAYLVFAVTDNKEYRLLNIRHLNVIISRQFNHTTEFVYRDLNDKKLPEFSVVEVDPGTYRLFDLLIQTGNTLVQYELDKEFYNFFQVKRGEIVFLGNFTVDKDGRRLTESYDFTKVKEKITSMHPNLEGFTWVTSLDDRQSF